jgi:hypothetical protein
MNVSPARVPSAMVPRAIFLMAGETDPVMIGPIDPEGSPLAQLRRPIFSESRSRDMFHL